jgi:integrase
VARSVGLPEKTGYHALRHYHASLLIFSGASVKTVQMALGHSTPTVTLNTYVGLWPEQIDRTRSLLDAALEPAPEGVAAT